jgi:pimeloyl-ACP methyl ester carboxylesterase
MLMEEWFTEGHAVQVPAGTSVLDAELQISDRNTGLIVMAHAGSGRRLQGRIQGLSEIFARAGFATLRMDLLTEEEAEIDGHLDAIHFDHDMLVERLDGAIDWVLDLPEAAHLPLAMFGSGSGAEAMLDVAAERGKSLTAIAAAGLACDRPPASLRRITIPTLLVAAEKDIRGFDLAKSCLQALPGRKRLEVLHGTGNVSNSLDKVARLACLWFEQFVL